MKEKLVSFFFVSSKYLPESTAFYKFGSHRHSSSDSVMCDSMNVFMISSVTLLYL